MNAYNSNDKAFLNRLISIVEANLGDENFGVSELAKEAGQNRSQLYIRVKSLTKKSLSQFIREIRLKKALELLQQTEMNVSEVSYKIGFSSPAYFNNCFHEQYGYPPGEAKKQVSEDTTSIDDSTATVHIERHINVEKRRRRIISLTSIIILSSIFLVLLLNSTGKKQADPLEKSIIVLPFKNLSSDENNQYFADGISEDILNQLTKITDLKVVSRTSAEQFRESSLSTPEIAHKVNANYLLEGSVRRHEDNVRLSVQLIDAGNDRHLWSENYDRQLDDIFNIQSDIAENVAKQLQSILSAEEIKKIEKRHPKNAEAYDKYLMGQYLCLKRDSLSIRKGIEYFKEAIAVDSNYTLAYAGLADGYYALAFTGSIERSSGYEMAYQMAEKALEMDSTLAEAYAVLGVVSYFGYWKWEEARKLLEKAVEIDSNCMVAHLYYCSFLDIIGDPENALKQVNKAIELEPYYHMTFRMKGVILRNERKFAESTEALKRSFELNKESYSNYYLIFLNDLAQNDEASAIKMLIKYFSIQSNFQKYENKVRPVYEASGITGVLKLLLDAFLNERMSKWSLATVYSLLKMQNEALNCLEIACRERERDIPRMISEPECEKLHSNPRFQALVDTMNLRPYFPESSE